MGLIRIFQNMLVNNSIFERLHGTPAVAYGIFNFRGNFRECFTERFVVKHGIIAEASVSLRFMSDFTLADAGSRPFEAVRPDKDKGTYKPRSPQMVWY